MPEPMRILTIVGARPQFIKAAMVSRAIAARPPAEGLQEEILHTGQHYDQAMSSVFFADMDIPRPGHELGIREARHGAMTGRMLEGIERFLVTRPPSLVLVYGDTNSTLAGTLAAAKAGIPVAHVEAGLRSGDRAMPEEINRKVADHLSTLLFCPTRRALENLSREGLSGQGVVLSGDVMLDASLHFRDKALAPAFPVPDRFTLATLHRQANVDDPAVLEGLIRALEDIHKELPVVLPLHPRTAQRLADQGRSPGELGFQAVGPVGYRTMLWLLQRCEMVLTDSGGLQKEAFFFSKPCVTLRQETEWTELVEAGANALAGVCPEEIREAFARMRGKAVVFDPNLYGQGMAAERIVHALGEFRR